MGAKPSSQSFLYPGPACENVLLTGANGFLGAEIARALRSAHIQTTRVVRRQTAALEEALVAVGDLADRNFLLGLPWNFDTVIHAAASWRDGSDFQRDNVRATQNLVEIAQKCGCERFILISSTSVYGAHSSPTLSHNSPLSPVSEYGSSKSIAESIVKSASDINPVIVRLPGIIGPGAHSGLLVRLVAAARQNAELKIHNPLTLFNSIVSVRNVANFVASLAMAEIIPEYRSVILGSSEPLPISRLAQTVVEETVSLSQIIPVGSSQNPYLIDYSVAEDFYGFVPEPVNKVVIDFLRHDPTSFQRL